MTWEWPIHSGATRSHRSASLKKKKKKVNKYTSDKGTGSSFLVAMLHKLIFAANTKNRTWPVLHFLSARRNDTSMRVERVPVLSCSRAWINYSNLRRTQITDTNECTYSFNWHTPLTEKDPLTVRRDQFENLRPGLPQTTLSQTAQVVPSRTVAAQQNTRILAEEYTMFGRLLGSFSYNSIWLGRWWLDSEQEREVSSKPKTNSLRHPYFQSKSPHERRLHDEVNILQENFHYHLM